MESENAGNWILRFAKGMLIGVGAILPGVSGGALAAVFGMYEKMIMFIAHLTREFKKNFFFFLPVGLGGVFGIFLLSFAVSYFLENAETQVLWFFIGCITGITPALYKQAGKNGRKLSHLVLTTTVAVVAFLFLDNAQSLITGTLELNVFTWGVAGIIIGLGLIVPGLSPSNFLVYLNMYKPMTDGIKVLDFGVIIPLGIGVVVTVITFSKIVSIIFEKAYTSLFHVILGIVIASTVMIIPRNYAYLSVGGFVCILMLAAGIVLGLWMSRLEDKYKN